jgi:hypothetical protein
MECWSKGKPGKPGLLFFHYSDTPALQHPIFSKEVSDGEEEV